MARESNRARILAAIDRKVAEHPIRGMPEGARRSGVAVARTFWGRARIRAAGRRASGQTQAVRDRPEGAGVTVLHLFGTALRSRALDGDATGRGREEAYQCG
jgi:hypothetical protein